MLLSELLNEQTVRIRIGYGTSLLVTENPTPGELMTALNQSKYKELRGLTTSNGNVMFWDAAIDGASHGEVIERMGLRRTGRLLCMYENGKPTILCKNETAALNAQVDELIKSGKFVAMIGADSMTPLHYPEFVEARQAIEQEYA